jgi:large subunit ribosomal protein L35
MPKMKTHKGSRKRFTVTGTGKLMRAMAGKRHLNSHKTRAAKRRSSRHSFGHGQYRQEVRHRIRAEVTQPHPDR